MTLAPSRFANSRHELPLRSVKVALPVAGNLSGWSRYGLVQRMMLGRRQRRATEELARAVVPKPVFTGLETSNDRMARGSGMTGGVLGGRVVAATDMAALGAASKMEPPASCRQAFDATVAARGDSGIDGSITHRSNPTSNILYSSDGLVVVGWVTILPEEGLGRCRWSTMRWESNER